MSEERKYWWCSQCEGNVDILIGYEVGIFCQQCGSKVSQPIDNTITGRVFWDNEEEDDDDPLLDRWIT